MGENNLSKNKISYFQALVKDFNAFFKINPKKYLKYRELPEYKRKRYDFIKQTLINKKAFTVKPQNLSVTFIANNHNVSLQTASKWLKELQKLGLITCINSKYSPNKFSKLYKMEDKCIIKVNKFNNFNKKFGKVFTKKVISRRNTLNKISLSLPSSKDFVLYASNYLGCEKQFITACTNDFGKTLEEPSRFYLNKQKAYDLLSAYNYCVKQANKKGKKYKKLPVKGFIKELNKNKLKIAKKGFTSNEIFKENPYILKNHIKKMRKTIPYTFDRTKKWRLRLKVRMFENFKAMLETHMDDSSLFLNVHAFKALSSYFDKKDTFYKHQGITSHHNDRSKREIHHPKITNKKSVSEFVDYISYYSLNYGSTEEINNTSPKQVQEIQKIGNSLKWESEKYRDSFASSFHNVIHKAKEVYSYQIRKISRKIVNEHYGLSIQYRSNEPFQFIEEIRR